MYNVFLILKTYLILSYDYLKITNDKNHTFGEYCGFKDGFHVIVTGDYVVLKFHSDSSVTRPGYLLSFNAFCEYSNCKVFRSWSLVVFTLDAQTGRQSTEN